MDSGGSPGRGSELKPQTSAYAKHNPRLRTLGIVLGLLLAVLAGGLAWRQIFYKPYVRYHNSWLNANYEGWLESNLPRLIDETQKQNPNWSEDMVAAKAGAGAKAEYAKIYLTDYEETANRQMLRRVLEPSPRGNIFDRKGRPLAVNQACYSVVLYVDELRGEFQKEFEALRQQWLNQHRDDTSETRPTINSNELKQEAQRNVARRYLEQADALLGRQDTLDEHALDLHVKQNLFLPYTLIKSLTPEEYARFNAQWPVDSSMQTSVEALRYYPQNEMAFHTLGYVSLTNDFSGDEVTGADLPAKDSYSFQGMKGGAGLEQLYDRQLSGKPGGEIWIVDPAMHLTERRAQQTPEKGANVTCSLDIDIQRVAEHAFLQENRKDYYTGSAVALDVRTGEVLAMANSPTFDLNRTVPGISYSFSDEVNAADGWLNRATQGLYPPGSTFKLISTIAGLRAGVLTADTIYTCDAFFPIGNRAFWDDTRTAQGDLNVVQALATSNDVFYYQFGVNINKIDKNILPAEARWLGLGQPTGIGLAEPAQHMIVPDAAWKKAHHPEDTKGVWNPADAAMLAVGQSYLQVTPLQMACVVASIARNETRTRPTLWHDPNLDPASVKHGGEPLGLTPEEREILITGMENVVSDERGTAHTYGQIPGLRIAGKTGTAQWGSHKNTTIAWFVCFAPVENPRIAVAVAVESPGYGSDIYGGRIAAPIARAIMLEYFKDYPEEIKK